MMFSFRQMDRIAKSTRRLLPCICLLVLASISVQLLPAQSTTVPLRLTLKDAVALALRQNLDIQVANIDTAERQQDRNVSRSNLLPQASLQATEEISRYNLEALIGLQFAGVAKNVGPFQSFRVGPRFSSPVFDLSLIRLYQASGHRLAASKDDLRSTREQTVLLTVAQYLAELRAQADVMAATSRVQLAVSLADQAAALQAGGVATEIDVSRAKVSLLDQKQRLTDAQDQVATAMFALKRILNVPQSQSIELLDKDQFTQTLAFEIPDAVDRALSQRPELQSLAEREAAARMEHQASSARSLPTLALNGGWNEQGRTPGNIYPGYDYELNFSVPLFTGGRLTAQRRLAALDQQRLGKQLQDARNRVSEQVRDDQTELNAAKSDVDLGREQVRLARQEVDLAQGRFAAGVTDNIEVTTAQDELARANDTEIGALYRFNIARANLARAVGSAELTYTQP